MPSDQTDVMSSYGGASRRSSYYGGGPDAQRHSSAGYYGSQNHGRPPRDSYDNGYGQGGPVGGGGGPPRVRYGNRMQSDPGWGSHGGRMSSQGQNVYGQPPPNAYQQSHDTVHTNGSNGSNSDGAYATDPSDNSSFERSMPVRPPHGDANDQYGANGFGGPIREEYGQQQTPYGAPPPPPHTAKAMPPAPKAAPIKLGGGESAAPAGRPGVLRKESSGGEDKRRSWFKRRFSKD